MCTFLNFRSRLNPQEISIKKETLVPSIMHHDSTQFTSRFFPIHVKSFIVCGVAHRPVTLPSAWKNLGAQWTEPSGEFPRRPGTSNYGDAAPSGRHRDRTFRKHNLHRVVEQNVFVAGCAVRRGATRQRVAPSRTRLHARRKFCSVYAV